MLRQTNIILAIESSCDDTAAAVLQGSHVLSNCIANQEIHKQYGGVVPELASRAHHSNIVPVLLALVCGGCTRCLLVVAVEPICFALINCGVPQ